MIIEEINRRYNQYLSQRGVDDATRFATQIIKDNLIHMTNLAIYASFSVNGVAKLHTEILKMRHLKNFILYSQRNSITKPMVSLKEDG